MRTELNTAPRTSPFCDKFCFSVPEHSHSLALDAVKPFLEQLGSNSGHNSYTTASGAYYFWKHTHGVVTHTITGQLLQELRHHGLYEELLVAVSLLPSYRLTRADITVDISIDGADVTPWVYSEAKARQLTMTSRQAKDDVRQFFSPSYTQPSKDTGSVYIGSPQAERRLKVYDKAQERFSRYGMVVMPTTRLELTLTCKTGLTIRDLVDAAPIYYHFMPRSLLSPPSSVKAWQPYESVGGYTVPKGERQTPLKRAQSLIDDITPALRAINKLAKEHPGKYDTFLMLCENRISRRLRGA